MSDSLADLPDLIKELPQINAENFPMMSEEAFERLLEQVERDGPMVILRDGKPSLVMLSIDLWNRLNSKE